MQVDIFCNRESKKILKGDILDVAMLGDDGSDRGFPHISITLNTGYNLLIEKQALEMVNRRVGELE